jgi:hypothetical protein
MLKWHRELLNRLPAGSRFERGLGKHPRIILPNGKAMRVPLTPSDYRATKQAIATARRISRRY